MVGDVCDPVAAAARRSVLQRAHLATPDCPSCGGKGWHMRRVEFGMAGVEAVACQCTEGRAAMQQIERTA